MKNKRPSEYDAKPLQISVYLWLFSFYLIFFYPYMVEETFSVTADREVSRKNNFKAEVLDIVLSKGDDFSPDLEEGGVSQRSIGIKSEGASAIRYAVRAKNFTGELCQQLALKASLDGNLRYMGKLEEFTDSQENFSKEDTWEFEIRLQGEALPEDACRFEFVFDGYQNDLDVASDEGFSDEEKVENDVLYVDEDP